MDHQNQDLDVAAQSKIARLRQQIHADDAKIALLEQGIADFNAAINHAIDLGLEAADFLRCWREGNWSGCAEFDFAVSEALRNPKTF